MGVDAKWGRFPIYPEMSRFVPVCPFLSRLVPVPGSKKDNKGQTGTKRNISGQIGKRPHFYPHLALLKIANRKNRCDFGALSEKRRDFEICSKDGDGIA